MLNEWDGSERARACISVKKGPRDLVGIFWESKLHIFCCSLLILFIYSVCLWVCVSVRLILCVRVRKWIAYIEVFQRTIASRRRTIKKMRVWWKGTELANCNIRSDGPRRNAFDFMLFSYPNKQRECIYTRSDSSRPYSWTNKLNTAAPKSCATTRAETCSNMFSLIQYSPRAHIYTWPEIDKHTLTVTSTTAFHWHTLIEQFNSHFTAILIAA